MINKSCYLRSFFHHLPPGHQGGDGDSLASWSKVIHLPPAATILSLAAVVNLRAHTVIFGTVTNLSSFKTFPTTTNVLALFSSVLATFTNLETDIGYLVVPLWFNLLWTIWLNLLSVLLAKNP